MTIKQALDEVNATDEQKKNGLDRLLKADKTHRFMPQMKRYVAAAAALVVAVGTAGVGIHFAVVNNQGGPINVSVGNSDTVSDSVVIPTDNAKVHSEKSGMTFVDDKTFWAQLGKITYRSVDTTPLYLYYDAEINAADDFDSLFCTDKKVQSEMLDLFDNAIDITEKCIVLTDINKAVGISSDMSTQEIEKFKNDSANYFTGTVSYDDRDERFYYADKAYFGFDTSEEFINTVSQVYTGDYSDDFKRDFYDYCPDYIQPADKNNTKSKFGIYIDKEFPITELYSAHTQYCTAFYTDKSHNYLILLSLTAKDGDNDSKTFELKYVPMKYVDGKLRIVISPYYTYFMSSIYVSNYMFDYGIEEQIGTDVKTVDITSVAGDSDNSVVIPAENTRVHSEKSGMTFVDDKSFWAQLGKITYRSVDTTPLYYAAEINAADDFDSLFCTDKKVQSEMLDLFDNAIDITEKCIVLTDINKAVGISSDMSTQEIEKFRNNSDNYFTGTDSNNDARFYYADKAYFGFDTSDELINIVSKVYTGIQTDNFTEKFYDYCPEYIQPADRNNAKSKFGINIDSKLPITELYSAHTQYCTAFYTDDSHNSLILLSLTAKDGNNSSKTFELKYISMRYVDGKLRVVVSPYDDIFINSASFSNYMFNYGLTSEIEATAKTVDITSVTGDSDNSSKPAETTAVTTVTTTASTTTAPATSTTPQTTATTTVTDKTTTAVTTAKPSPEPTGTATNVTLRMTGDESYFQRGYLYYLKVSDEFINNSDVLEYTSDKMSEYPMFNTDGSDHTFDSIECGTYIIAGPWLRETNDSGYAVFRVTESDSNGVINIDLNNTTVAKDKIKVVEPVKEEEPLPESDKLAMVFDDSITFEGEKYRMCSSEDTYFKADGNYLKDIASDDRKFRIIYYLPDYNTRVNVNGKELTYDEIKENVLLCEHHPLGGNSDYFRIYVKESFCEQIKKTTGAKSVTALAAYIDYDYNYGDGIEILGDNTKFGVSDKDGNPIANESFIMYYLDYIDRYLLENNIPLTSRFAEYNPDYGDDFFDTNKNGMIPTSTEDPNGDGVLVQSGFQLYPGTAVIMKRSDVYSNNIGDNYTVCVYNISDDGITFEASYPYSMFKDRIWANNSYHNSKE